MKIQLYSLDEIKRRLYNRNLKEVSRETGISYPTIYALAKGTKKDFRMSTMIAMTSFLDMEETLKQVLEE